jgi:hypothetical protein
MGQVSGNLHFWFAQYYRILVIPEKIAYVLIALIVYDHILYNALWDICLVPLILQPKNHPEQDRTVKAYMGTLVIS